MDRNDYRRRVHDNRNYREISYVKLKDSPEDTFFFSLRAYGETLSRKNFVREVGSASKVPSDYVAVEFIRQGELAVSFQSGKFLHLRENDLILYRYRSDDVIPIHSCGSTLMVKKYVIVEMNQLLQYFLNLSDEPYFLCRCKHPEKIESSFEKIRELVQKGGEFQAGDLSCCLYGLFYDFFMLESEKPHTPDLASAIVQAISNYPEKYRSLKMLLQEFRITAYALKKLFRERYKTTPMAFLIREKLEKARWYLENTTTPVNEIARLCGVRNVSLFIRQFRREFSCTPGTYRKRKQRVLP